MSGEELTRARVGQNSTSVCDKTPRAALDTSLHSHVPPPRDTAERGSGGRPATTTPPPPRSVSLPPSTPYIQTEGLAWEREGHIGAHLHLHCIPTHRLPEVLRRPQDLLLHVELDQPPTCCRSVELTCMKLLPTS